MLRTDIHIRIGNVEDAPAISRVILEALRKTNARDYTPVIIERIAASFSPHHVAQQVAERQVLVATPAADPSAGNVIGTVSFEKGALRSFFVDPAYHGEGIGTALLEEIESLAAAKGFFSLSVAASITAETFYRRRGYKTLRPVQQGNVRVILMQKELN